jgi:hypothetical protein
MPTESVGQKKEKCKKKKRKWRRKINKFERGKRREEI